MGPTQILSVPNDTKFHQLHNSYEWCQLKWASSLQPCRLWYRVSPVVLLVQIATLRNSPQKIPSVSLNICSFTDTGPVRAAPLQLVSQFLRVVYLVILYIISLNFMTFITSTDGTNSKHFLTTCTTGTSCSACFATFPTWTSHEYWTSLLICNVIGVLPRVS